MKKLTLIFLLLCFTVSVQAQTPGNPAQQAAVEQMLAGRGIDQEELRQRLAVKGIYMENLTPEEAIRLRPQIEAVIAEMEQEEKIKKEAVLSADKIEEDVDDGTSVEEATAEVASKEVDEVLPKSQIYGHNIFRNRSLSLFQASNDATPPETYPLKVGDQLAVNIFGASQTDFVLRINEEGFVELPNTIRIPLAGVSLGEARRLLANRLKRSYTFSDGQLTIQTQVTRTINVNIFGEVTNSGSFNISSLNTGFNALVAAGGPSERGSVRNIKLTNGDKTTTLDVYAYLRNPAQQSSQFLQDNAIIFVPFAETVVEATGGVQRPMFYELKADETLADLIDYAGGTTPRAEPRSVRITRYVDGELRLINIDLTVQPDFELQNGDVVSVPEVENPVSSFVTVEGAVLLPGRYAFEESMTVATLLEAARLRPGARRDVAFLTRRNEDGTRKLSRIDLTSATTGADAGAMMKLKQGDVLQILASERFLDQGFITISGAVRDSSRSYPFPDDGGLKLSEAILLAGGLQANARNEASIIRTPRNNQEEREYLTVPLNEAATQELAPGDQVVIYTRERFTDAFQVSIRGAVRQPGSYRYDPSLQLSDLLTLAGGFRLEAARNKVDVFRLSITQNEPTQTLTATLEFDNDFQLLSSSDPNFQLQPSDIIVVRSAPEFENIQTVFVQGEVRYPGEYALDQDNLRLLDLVKNAGGLSGEAFAEGATLVRRENNVGFVVIRLDEVLSGEDITTNIVLKPGDLLRIPKAQELVSIRTLNTNADSIFVDSLLRSGEINLAFTGEKKADWYIKNFAAGYDEDAWKKTTRVVLPNGEIKGTKRFLFFKTYPIVEPGSTVAVDAKPPRKQKKPKPDKEPFDWGQFARDTVAAATSVLTLILLTQRID
ncbi:SLBB domain-containing protein [Neolewinella aurantiaca]|uniref:SLBB domain-containing protein n=1 Tax=Neolewinella aurantiaca TaxID=2602767 RepID=UPI001650093E|nr:SLBB domain-containing protein [Neolewinella aurantiaca]